MGLFRLTKPEHKPDPEGSKAAAAKPATEDVRIAVRRRRDMANGFFEATVTIDNERPSDATLVLTAPRDLAFRKAG